MPETVRAQSDDDTAALEEALESVCSLSKRDSSRVDVDTRRDQRCVVDDEKRSFVRCEDLIT
jgi:hypothetical protein